MEIMKAAFRDVSGNWMTCDAIDWQGKRWLVGRWLENKGLGIAKPARIVRVDNLPCQVGGLPALQQQVDFVVLMPIPKFVFDPDNEQRIEAPYEGIDHPDITVELPDDGTRQ